MTHDIRLIYGRRWAKKRRGGERGAKEEKTRTGREENAALDFTNGKRASRCRLGGREEWKTVIK